MINIENTLVWMEIRNVRHIFSQALDIRIGSLRIRQFSLNRHLADEQWVDAHGHFHSQFLLYLTGSGHQRVASSEHQVRPGMVFFLPPDCEHAFIEGEGRRPLCLALDFETTSVAKPTMATLAQTDLRIIRQALSVLHGWHPGNTMVLPRQAAAVLQILDVLMKACGLLPKQTAMTALPIVRKVREAFREPREGGTPIALVAEMVGYHRDHLTRILRRETGMSAGQLRASEILKRAQSFLSGTDSVALVAEKCGFSDPNYFTRWFRKQTGKSPRQWRKVGRI